VEVVLHKLPEEEMNCTECNELMHVMGHDVRRELKIVPAQAKVVEHTREVCSCRNCEKNNDHVPIVKAPMPEPVIKGSLASPSAVAHIMTQKYVMYAPLYRQEKDWERQGVYLSRQTMANWVIRCSADWLRPIYDNMKRKLLAHEVLHADETVVQVLNVYADVKGSEADGLACLHIAEYNAHRGVVDCTVMSFSFFQPLQRRKRLCLRERERSREVSKAVSDTKTKYRATTNTKDLHK
jgi:transposase